MTRLHLLIDDTSAIRLGYRTPGLTAHLDAAGKMALAQELGMSVVEPQCNPREITDTQVARDLAHAADAAGIAIDSVGCELPLSARGDDPEFGQRLDFALEVAAILEARWIFTRVLAPDAGVAQDRSWQTVIERARSAAVACAAVGRELLIEADPGTFVHTLERQRRLLEAVGHPALRPNFDPCNLYVGGSDVDEAIATFGDRIASLHTKDGIYRSERRGEVALGTGELDWGRILGALRARGIALNGFVEHCTHPDQVRAAAAHLQRVIAELLVPA